MIRQTLPHEKSRGSFVSYIRTYNDADKKSGNICQQSSFLYCITSRIYLQADGNISELS